MTTRAEPINPIATQMPQQTFKTANAIIHFKISAFDYYLLFLCIYKIIVKLEFKTCCHSKDILEQNSNKSLFMNFIKLKILINYLGEIIVI